MWHCGHELNVGALSLCVERRFVVRECDCRCFGTAMRHDRVAGSAPRAHQDGRPRLLDWAPCSPTGCRSARWPGVRRPPSTTSAPRGTGYGDDLTLLLDSGSRLLAFEDRAVACVREGAVQLLAARDEDAAELILWAALTSSPPGSTALVLVITAAQQWAIRVVLDAHLWAGQLHIVNRTASSSPSPSPSIPVPNLPGAPR